ncbi:MAG TPA: LysM peptidoglycan-binding domain-containing protein [Dehalococcoidia bacterium]|nr:LysM peptidoglycan-binding domain-containing protein [Dehalococcoidia bacterium]
MPEFLTCFACEQEPTQQCPRCGRPYCDDHGEDVCDACLNPSSGLPSFTLYRGSLLALLGMTVLALILLIQPPGGEGNAPQAGTIITPTPQVQVQTTPPAGSTQPANGTPGANPTARPGATATAAPSGGSGTYTVVSGDSLSSICSRVKPASMSVNDCVEQVVSLNSLSDAGSISAGQVLKIPQ